MCIDCVYSFFFKKEPQTLPDSYFSQEVSMSFGGRHLSVTRVLPSQYNFMVKMMENWKEIAELQENLVNSKSLSDEESLRITSRLESCRCICAGLGKMIEEGRCQVLYACCDESLRTQSLMAISVEETHIKIDRLVTHPYNIFSFYDGQKASAVRGAGSLLLRQAECLAENAGKPEIKLISTWGASSFYEKQGFRNLGFSFFGGGLSMVKMTGEQALTG